MRGLLLVVLALLFMNWLVAAQQSKNPEPSDFCRRLGQGVVPTALCFVSRGRRQGSRTGSCRVQSSAPGSDRPEPTEPRQVSQGSSGSSHPRRPHAERPRMYQYAGVGPSFSGPDPHEPGRSGKAHQRTD